MENAICSKCGRQAARNVPCPNCGQVVEPPAEVSGWAIEKTPPDLLAWARQTFDEEEYTAAVREIEATGGAKFEDFIGEIETRVRRRG